MAKVEVKIGNTQIEVEVPAAPEILPDALKEKFAQAYVSAYKKAAQDGSQSDADRKQSAMREANRILEVEEPTSAEEAEKLPKWQVLRREVVGGQLKVVTIDGKKFSFPVKKAPPQGAASNGPGTQGGAPAGALTGGLERGDGVQGGPKK